MPNRDKTGPQGKGSRTGRGLGTCTSPQTRGKTQKPRIRSTRARGK